jgi:hypothetical protein
MRFAGAAAEGSSFSSRNRDTEGGLSRASQGDGPCLSVDENGRKETRVVVRRLFLPLHSILVIVKPFVWDKVSISFRNECHNAQSCRVNIVSSYSGELIT